MRPSGLGILMKYGRKLTLLSLLLFLALSPIRVEAKNSGRIAGKIKNENGDFLYGAVITLFKESYQGGTISFTRSDRRGAYRLANLTPGSYHLQVTHQDYQPLTRADITINPDQTTSLDVILEEIIDYISNDEDPRNWGLETVMRSSSDRRFIFRYLPGSSLPDNLDESTPFNRSGTMNVSSSTGLGSEQYSVIPQTYQNGIVSNFAITEPLNQNSRVIFSGQLSTGYDSFWRVSNTYNHHTDDGRDYRIAVGLSRMNLSNPTASAITRPSHFFTQNPALLESGAQTLALGFAGTNKIWETLAINYGVDYTRFNYGTTKSYFSPFFQILLSPTDSWLIKSSVTSKRVSETNSVMLPDRELLNLSEPTLITMVDNEIHVSQLKHTEISVQKTVAEETAIEIAVYKDQTQGPGLPFLATTSTPYQSKSYIAQLNEEQLSQQGMRLTVNRKILDYLNGSITYVYGSAANVSNIDDEISSAYLARNLLNYMQQSYFHSLTSQFNATIPRTKTSFTTVVRWYPGTALTPIDWFADWMDIGTKSVNFQIRQSIPMPELVITTGQWEALLDIRNLFDQGSGSISTADGDVTLTRNPRRLRFGLNLSFY